MKMTKIKKMQLETKLQQSRSRLMEEYPFFAILLMYLKFVAVDNIRNISTNGRCIFFNADFVSKLYPNELDFILCHQVLHIANGDIWRGQAWVGDDYHRACDIYNNDQLMKIGFRVGSFSHLGKLQYKIPMYSEIEIGDLNPLEIYNLLPYKLRMLDEKTQKRYMTDSDFYWDYKNSDRVDGVVVLDVPKMTKYVGEEERDSSKQSAAGAKRGAAEAISEGEELEDFWTNRIERAFTTTQGMGKQAGKIPAGIKRNIEKSKKRDVDWKTVLDEFVQEEITDYSFTPPDRRFSDGDFFIPDFNEKDFMPKDILFMVDTSGSVEMEELSRVYGEICGAIEQFNGKLCGRLGFFDCNVTDPISFESVEDIDSIIPYGGGGTSFEVIFEYVREHLNEFCPAMIVIFTDGYADFPEESAAMHIPVLWLISNRDVNPPWGKVGRVV